MCIFFGYEGCTGIDSHCFRSQSVASKPLTIPVARELVVPRYECIYYLLLMPHLLRSLLHQDSMPSDIHLHRLACCATKLMLLSRNSISFAFI